MSASDTIANHSESAASMVAKAAPALGVSAVTVAGFDLSTTVLWLTFIYTVLMIGHKLYQIWKDLWHGFGSGK